MLENVDLELLKKQKENIANLIAASWGQKESNPIDSEEAQGILNLLDHIQDSLEKPVLIPKQYFYSVAIGRISSKGNFIDNFKFVCSSNSNLPYEVEKHFKQLYLGFDVSVGKVIDIIPAEINEAKQSVPKTDFVNDLISENKKMQKLLDKKGHWLRMDKQTADFKIVTIANNIAEIKTHKAAIENCRKEIENEVIAIYKEKFGPHARNIEIRNQEVERVVVIQVQLSGQLVKDIEDHNSALS